MLARDHYATLGVPPTASQEEIEEAYRHLCRRYHPEINPGDRQAALVFERIEEAYQVLSDPERRARYDREGSLADGLLEQGPDLRVQVLPEGGEGTYAELFRRLRDHARRSRPLRGQDVSAHVEVPLRLAELGRRAYVTVQRREPCRPCGGRGRVELQRHRPCERCGGSGQETFVKGALSISCSCAECGGEGIVAGLPCPDCRGEGTVLKTRKVLVRIPPGVRDGQLVRVTGAGHAGTRGGEPGDLVVRCTVQPVPGFERQGPHLLRTVPITIAEAVLGGKVSVTTLDGEAATVRVPPGTSSGRLLRLRGRGLELPDGRRGDMLVRVEIVVPTLVDEDSKELIRQFAARNPESPRAGHAREVAR